MSFNSEKFQYFSYHIGESINNNIVYITPCQNIIGKSTEVKDLGILMSENSNFNTHVASVVIFYLAMFYILGVVGSFLWSGRAHFGSFSKTLRAHISESTLPNKLIF